MVPQLAPWTAQVVGVQPQASGTAPPPQVWGKVQMPQLSLPPQPSW
jgi:hypothetical protein